MSLNLLIICVTLVITFANRLIGQSCYEIVPDAITQLYNESIAVFQDKNVWLYDLENKELMGPCPISKLYEGMDGPVDAAVTIWAHLSVTEFVGTSIYFTEGNFMTFKNLRPYQVEWGYLMYLPVKGEQTNMGGGTIAKDLMV